MVIFLELLEVSIGARPEAVVAGDRIAGLRRPGYPSVPTGAAIGEMRPQQAEWQRRQRLRRD
jgi:hypothetical protein